jgi:hypothetical protein
MTLPDCNPSIEIKLACAAPTPERRAAVSCPTAHDMDAANWSTCACAFTSVLSRS